MNAVVDASVFVAAMADRDADGEWARSVLELGRLAAPQLVHVEVMNAFRGAIARRVLSTEAAALAMAEVLEVPIRLFPFDIAAGRAWELRHALSSYDAWYVALAELLELPLATLDRRLARANSAQCAFLVPA